MNEGIIQIPVDKIWQHPDNPRKDLGDLTELTASIKANGILQNLTVVPLIGEISEKWDGESYRCLIGHRRLAAAKKAGLATVPCAVADLTEKEQLRVMMMENMQRADLTVLEQARGFQLMLDFGDTVPEIAEGTGFSESTVRRRLELAQVDRIKPKATEAAFQRGATLEDFAEVQKISDPADRVELLEVMGTANFRSRLIGAQNKEKGRERIAHWKETLDTFAEEDPDCGRRPDTVYVRSYGYWQSQNTEVEVPEDAGDAVYLYKVSGWQEINLYRVRKQDEMDRRQEQQKQEEERRRADQAKINSKSAAVALHHRLRADFVRNLSDAACKQQQPLIVALLGEVLLDMTQGDYACPELDPVALAELMGLKLPEDALEELTEDGDLRLADVEPLAEALRREPHKALLALTFATADDKDNGYADARWAGSLEHVIEFENNPLLDQVYEVLEALGYEKSDGEKAMGDGTHEIFDREDAE